MSGRTTALLARLLYAVVVLFATFTGLHLDPDPGAAARRLARALHPSVSGRDVVDGVRNLLLFAGFGVTWVATGPRRAWWRAALAATASGCVLSAFVEGGQLFSPVRVASVLDVATNTLGALAGALLTAAVVPAIVARRRAKSYVGVPAFAFGVPYLGAALLEAAWPLFRHATVPGVWGGPRRRWAAAVEASRYVVFAVPPFDAAIFVPAGALLVATFAELGASLPAAAMYAVVSGAVLAAAAELARGVVGQPMHAGALVAHVVGLTLGATLAWRLLPAATQRLRGRARALGLALVYALVLAAWAWRPFELDLSLSTLSAEFAAEHFIPLYALGGRGDLFSVADVGVQFLLYVPLGALAAVWPLRRQGVLRGPGAAVLLALVLEAGQLVVADRFFDVTDWMVATAGVLVGWAVARRAGYRPYGTLLPTGVRGEPAAEARLRARRVT